MAATYRDIKADILGKIARGELQAGAPMPTEQELSERYGTARATVNRAMRELADEGLIERKRRSGTRIRQSPRRRAQFDIPIVRVEIEEQDLAYGYTLLHAEVVAAPGWLSQRLGPAELGEVLHLACLHRADGRPYQHEDRWINLTLLPDARAVDFGAIGPNEWLVTQVPFSEVEITITAADAHGDLAEHLGCAPGAGLLQIERQTRWQGSPVTFVRLSHQPGHRMTARY